MIKRPGFTRKRSGDQRGRFKSPARASLTLTPEQIAARAQARSERARMTQAEITRTNRIALRQMLSELAVRVATKDLTEKTFILRPPFPYEVNPDKPPSARAFSRDDVVRQGRPVFTRDDLELYV